MQASDITTREVLLIRHERLRRVAGCTGALDPWDGSAQDPTRAASSNP